ncbi:hypothetical protein BDR07DRAFT_285927 [Suillus spraguei]|nr:hypothetical protein BDR07DRAFT_285927 [Suillus spraguei]
MIISNDPSWWPLISSNMFYSYWTVAAGVVLIYDWMLTLGQEVELIWRQRLSLMTVLYLVIRYIGVPYCVMIVLGNMPSVSLTDTVSNIINYARDGTNLVISSMLGVITIARLHAMYRKSTMMLVFLVIIWFAVTIACGVLAAIAFKHIVLDELMILSGTYMCDYVFDGDASF